MQSENVNLTQDKDVIMGQSLDKLEGKDEKKPNSVEQLKQQEKKGRKATKVKVAKRLCIFE